ncbi:MAG: EpsG family protein, partial [Oscillospiraceae bacterium]
QKKLLDKDKKNIILINCAYLGLIFFAFFGWVPVYTRIGQYMTILSLFLIPKIIDCEDNIKIKNVYKIGLIVGFSAFMIIMLINAKSQTIKLLPYKNILFDF